MALRLKSLLFLIWLCFVIRGAFYAKLMPLWEGFDEYAHFARFSQSLLPSANDGISREIEASFHLAPLPDQLAWMGSFCKIHPQWWVLPESDRLDRRSKLRSIPPEWAYQTSITHYDSYEAQQPPLYYWLLLGPARLADSRPLPDRVLLLRLLSILIASATIPLTYLAARNTLDETAALSAAALLAISPMLSIDTARVANDALAMTATAALIYFTTNAKPRWWLVGLALGVALLSKAYLLTLIPAVVIVWRRRPVQLCGALATAGAVSGWWYLRNIVTTGKLTGWADDAPFGAILQNIPQVQWGHAAGAVLKSGIWFGGWSFLTIKAWMYNLLLTVLIGAVALSIRKTRKVWLPGNILFWFLIAIVYDVAAEFTTQKISAAPGWYIWGICAAVAILIGAGAGRFGIALVALWAALDLYTSNFILLPYYSGLAAHGRSFAKANLMLEGLQRLDVPIGLWALSTTLTMVAVLILALPRETDVTSR